MVCLHIYYSKSYLPAKKAGDPPTKEYPAINNPTEF